MVRYRHLKPTIIKIDLILIIKLFIKELLIFSQLFFEFTYPPPLSFNTTYKNAFWNTGYKSQYFKF